MKNLRLLWVIALMWLLAGCGVSPRVRVERAAGTSSKPATLPTRSMSAAGTHLVTKGDTLYSIAFRNGLDVRDLIAWNTLVAPYTIYPGQPLRLQPQHATRPPTVAATANASMPLAKPSAPSTVTATTPLVANAPKPGPGTQAVIDDAQAVKVEPLELPSSGQAATAAMPRGAPPAAGQPGSLIAAIGASPKAPPRPGERPSPGYNAARTVVVLPPPAVAAAPGTGSLPTTSSATVASSTAAAATTFPVRIDNAGPSLSREGIQWRWPSSGTLIGRFVAGDPTQQGIDIVGTLGQPVTAVADGEVVYSGNGLLGYGEMIIVQHSPDYLSAYGHNRRRLMAEGDKVKAGQMIAEMGQRGNQVMLHFEVRRRGKPVDPLSYMPPR